MTILLDEMWSSTIAEQLRQRGYDVIAVSEPRDLRGKRDDIILATAQREQLCGHDGQRSGLSQVCGRLNQGRQASCWPDFHE